MRRFILKVLPSLLAGLTACSTIPKVYTQRDTTVDIARYRNFAVLPLAVSGPGIGTDTGLRLAGPAESAVRKSLSEKGLTETCRDQADGVVFVLGESIPNVEVTSLVYCTNGAQVVAVQTTNQRRLTVEVYDNRTHRLAWIGWVERTGSDPVKTENVQAGIRRILEDFPTAKSAVTK